MWAYISLNWTVSIYKKVDFFAKRCIIGIVKSIPVSTTR